MKRTIEIDKGGNRYEKMVMFVVGWCFAMFIGCLLSRQKCGQSQDATEETGTAQREVF